MIGLASDRRPADRLAGLLALGRISNLPTVWMNVVTAGVLATDQPQPGRLALLAISMSAFYCGGMVLNDLFDRHHDRLHQPFRPIPMGRVRTVEARALAVVLFALGFGLLLGAPHAEAALAGLLLFAVIYAYDRFHKRHPATVLLMACCRGLVFVVSSWAVVGGVPLSVAVAAVVQVVYTLAVTVVARREGRRGDGRPSPVPRLLAAMSLVDGVVLSLARSPLWLLPAAFATLLTRLGQRFVRGD